MKIFVLVIMTLVLNSALSQTITQDVLWDPRNVIFDNKTCSVNSRTFYAKFDDQFNIVCANPNINIGLADHTPIHPSLFFYNVFFTDNESVYKSRNGFLAKLVHKCQVYEHEIGRGVFTPAVYRRKIPISRFGFGMFKGLKENKRYWFFTTSNGTEASLKNKIGDENSMGIELEICADTSECKQRQRKEICLHDEKTSSQGHAQQEIHSIIMMSPPEIISPVSSNNSLTSNESVTSQDDKIRMTSRHDQVSSLQDTSLAQTHSNFIWIVSIVLALILGILIGILLMILKTKFCNKQQSFATTTGQDEEKEKESKKKDKERDMIGDLKKMCCSSIEAAMDVRTFYQHSQHPNNVV